MKDPPIGWIEGDEATIEAISELALLDIVDVSGTRELGQSLEYGLVALVDIAIMALSPAVNDPNTAVEVIEEIGFLFPKIAELRPGGWQSSPSPRQKKEPTNDKRREDPGS